MIVCITGLFDVYKNGIKTGAKEFVVSHGIEYNTLRHVILPCEHPSKLGAKIHPDLREWVIYEKDECEASTTAKGMGGDDLETL